MGSGLGQLVEKGEARYVLLGGAYSLRGGNRATVAVLQACRQLKLSDWHSPSRYTGGITLFDCGGDAHALASAKPLSTAELEDATGLKARP